MPAGAKGYAYRRALLRDETDDLSGLLAKRFGANAYAVLHCPDDAQFASFDSAAAGPFVEWWAEGRIFDDNAELRWRATADGYGVLLLTEEDDPPAGFRALDSSPFTVVNPSPEEGHGFLLWGTRHSRDLWWEARIPRPLTYPLKTTGAPPRLVYRLYLKDEAVRWVRLVGLKEVD